LTPPNVDVVHRIQTNATLIDQEWCDLFAKGGIQVGVSLDGPEDLNDSQRVDRRGKGTFAAAWRGLQLLKANSIPFFLLAVLTEASLDRAEEIWRLIRESGATSIGFNMESVLNAHSDSSLKLSGAGDRLHAFLEKIWELREIEAPEIFIRELDNMRRL